MIPPEQSGDFVAYIEQVLDIYKRPYDPLYPVVCMDESPRQLIGETRRMIPAGYCIVVSGGNAHYARHG